jgi:hypothetical protein
VKGTVRVMDVGATRGASGVMGAAWGTVEVVGASRDMDKVTEAGGDEAT